LVQCTPKEQAAYEQERLKRANAREANIERERAACKKHGSIRP
jgi:hypothetical protein